MLTPEIKHYIDKSILCWLATVSKDLEPNVSPKELFTYTDDTTLLIANIASPQSANNIKTNPKVCVSFIDVLVQKGYKVKGNAKIIEKTDDAFIVKSKILTKKYTDLFPFVSIIEINITKVDAILAPSYVFFPSTKEADQIESAVRAYFPKK
jgi:uncharacterized protein